MPDISRLQLADDDFKGIYYRDKFGVAVSDVEFIGTVKQAFVEAMQWVMLYYYRGVRTARGTGPMRVEMQYACG